MFAVHLGGGELRPTSNAQLSREQHPPLWLLIPRRPMDVDFEETNRRQLEHSYTECATRSVRTRLGAWVPTLARRGLACRAR